MALTPTGPGRLRVLDACREGWIAFGRAPWPLLLFSLLSSLAMGACVVPIALGAAVLVMTPQAIDYPDGALPGLIVMLVSLGAVLVGVLLLGVVALQVKPEQAHQAQGDEQHQLLCGPGQHQPVDDNPIPADQLDQVH